MTLVSHPRKNICFFREFFRLFAKKFPSDESEPVIRSETVVDEEEPTKLRGNHKNVDSAVVVQVFCVIS